MENINKQLSVDLVCSLAELDQDVFKVGDANDEMFYYHRSPGIAILRDGRLYVRADSGQLVQAIAHKYRGKANQWFFEVENIKSFEALLASQGYQVNQWGICMIPNIVEDIEDSRFRLFYNDQIKQFAGNNDFDECFIFEEQDPDRIGVGYEIDGILVGMAGCNQNGKYAYEIGVNVLPAYQGQGIATKLIKKITWEIEQLSQGQGIAIAGTQFSHSISMKTILKAGYEIGWSQIAFSKIENK